LVEGEENSNFVEGFERKPAFEFPNPEVDLHSISIGNPEVGLISKSNFNPEVNSISHEQSDVGNILSLTHCQGPLSLAEHNATVGLLAQRL